MKVGMMPAALSGCMVGMIRLSKTCDAMSEKELFEIGK